MYYKTDESGNYLGIKSESNEKMEFWTETPISGNFTKHRCINDVWIEGGNVDEPTKEEAPQEVIDFIETLKQKYNL